MKQKILLRIVQAWDLKEKPEYRRFKCGNCGKYLYKAWHYWCLSGGYKTPVHFCNKCQSNFESSNIKVIKSKTPVKKRKFGLRKFPRFIRIKLREIVDSWDIKSKPICKTFACDDCGKSIYKAYHFWFRLSGILSEAHFCRKCGQKLGLNKSK